MSRPAFLAAVLLLSRCDAPKPTPEPPSTVYWFTTSPVTLINPFLEADWQQIASSAPNHYALVRKADSKIVGEVFSLDAGMISAINENGDEIGKFTTLKGAQDAAVEAWAHSR